MSLTLNTVAAYFSETVHQALSDNDSLIKDILGPANKQHAPLCLCFLCRSQVAFLGSRGRRSQRSVRSCRRDSRKHSGDIGSTPALTHINVSQEVTHSPRSRCRCCIQGVKSYFIYRCCGLPAYLLLL